MLTAFLRWARFITCWIWLRRAARHGPIHLLASSAADIGFRWDSHVLNWARPGLPALSNLAGPIQHFRSAILGALQGKVAADSCAGSGFRGGPLLDVLGWNTRRWRRPDVFRSDDGMVQSCRGFCFVPDVCNLFKWLNSGVIFALQASASLHLWVCNFNVVGLGPFVGWSSESSSC